MGDKTYGKRKGPVRRFFGALGRGILTLMFIGIISGSIVASVMALFIFNSLEGASDLDLDIEMSNTSQILAISPTTGEYEVVKQLYGEKNRDEVKYEQLPQEVIDVTVAAEDKRFWEHHGVDWYRTIGSTFTFVTGQSTQGGSTITQQVIKNITDNDEFSPERKVQEIFAALKLEKKYTKETILETYLNVAFFGNHCYGIQSAAKFYFNKPLDELNVAEIATIVATTNAPTKYNPLRQSANEEYGWGTGIQENKERRNYILSEMVKMGTLTQAEYDQWSEYDVTFSINNEETDKTDPNELNSWFLDQVIEDVIDDLVEEKEYTEAYASQQIYNAGLRIYSTMDQTIQNRLEEQYKDPNTFPPILNQQYPETCAVIMTPDGALRGLVGGNTKDGNRMFNRATMSKRHPGSTMKPISAYLQAFEMDMVTWSTMFEDAPIDIKDDKAPGGTRKWPINYTNTYSETPITVQYAIQQSINTVPAQLVQRITPEVCWDFLDRKLQISTLDEMDKTLSSMALGGMAYGMKPVELIGSYQIFLSGGKYVKPYTYTKVTDREGNVVLEKDTKQVRVISEETATVLNRLLQTVVTNGTGAGANLGLGMPTGGKTGSSTGQKMVNGVMVDINNPDLWFVGFTPYYLGGVWMGYDQQDEIRYSTYPTPKLWKTLMLPIHQDLEVKDFTYSENVKQMTYCLTTGDLATTSCPNTAVGWYKDTFVPSNCTLHRFGASSAVDEEFEEAGSGSSGSKPGVIKKKDPDEDSSRGTIKKKSEVGSILDRFFGNED